MTLHIAPGLKLPVEYVTKTAAILAQRRKGKTYTAAVIAEEMVSAGLPFVALDPTGAWWGLRAAADAQGPGLPVTILGGEHGDVPLDRTDGKGVAELVVDEPGWYVIDFSLFESNAAEVQFAADFAQRLYRRKGQPNSDFPLHLFVDEADRFVPQRWAGGRDEGPGPKMLGAFEAIVRRGGLRGLGTTLISQRTAVVNKNVLEQADLFFILRTVGPNDRKRIMEIVRAEGTAEQIAEIESSMASLDLGEAWLWEPGEGMFERVRIRERRTFNSSATPKPGEKRVEPRQLAAVDLGAIKERWAEQLERAKADDPAYLRQQIAGLKRELAKRPTETKVETVTETIEVPVIPDALLDALQDLEGELRQPHPALARLGAVYEAVKGADKTPRTTMSAPRPAARPAPVQRPQRAVQPRPADGDLPEGEAKVLTVAAQYPDGATREQMSILTGYKRSTRDAYIARLRAREYVTVEDTLIIITDAGFDALGPDFEPLPTGGALRDYWLARLPEGEARILAEVIDAWPGDVPRDVLSERTDYKRSTRDAYIQRLKARQLVAVTSGGIRAAEVLFS